MSPEILEGKGLDSPAIDFWALGIIMYELLVGLPPFNDTTIGKVFENIKRNRIDWDEIEPTEEGEEIISENAKSLIGELLQSVPSMRLGTDSVDDIKQHPFFSGTHQLNQTPTGRR